MSFIGNSFTNQSFVPQVDYFNGNASTTAFTLSRSVGSSYDVQVVIENVPQNPSSAFTVSGNVITFTSAPPSGTNNIYVRYTSPTTQVIKPAQGTVGPTELNSAYSLWNLSGSAINYTAGNVGIGTASPTTKLDVVGSLKVTNSSGSSIVANRTSNPGSVEIQYDGTQTAQFSALSGGGLATYVGSTPTEAMRITSSGNVGINTASPLGQLDINGSQSNISLRMIPTVEATNVADIRTLSVRRISTDSVLGIGYATSPDAWFISPSFGGTGSYKPLAFATSDTERMRILADGSILLGTSTQGGATGISFSNASDSAAYGKSMYMNSPYNGTRNAISFAYNSAGGVGQIVTGTNSVSYQSGSDYRLKENIAPMTGALATVTLLKPVTFKWKSDSSDGQGFIAHELQEVVPDCVTGEKDAIDKDGKPVYQGVDTSFLVATLTAAIQELKAEFDEYKRTHP
jgi:hypothetical protein